MKIAFCGDSFCSDIFNFALHRWDTTIAELINPVFNPKHPVPFEPYPYIVAQEFGAEILCSGQSGGTLYNSYEVLMKYIQEADYIVYCITESARLNNKYRLPISASNINATDYHATEGNELYQLALWNKVIDFNMTKHEEKELKVAAEYFYRMIYFSDWAKTIQRALLREIDTVIKEYKKKCIFFRGFSQSFCDYTPENVVWVNLALYDDITKRQDQINPKKDDEWRPNHFTEQNNRNMANFIIDVIKKDDFTPRELDMKEYFK